jgi:hypothetical protein
MGDRFPYLMPRLPERMGGRTFRSAGQRGGGGASAGLGRLLPGRGTGPELAIGPRGVSIWGPEARLSIAFEDAVGIAKSSAERIVFSVTGNALTVRAADWRDGASALRSLDESAPRHLAFPYDGELVP